MKNLTLRFLFMFAALLMQHFYSAAQVECIITQNPTYPCDTGSAGQGNFECIHVCAGDTVEYSSVVQGIAYKWGISGGGTIIGADSLSFVTVAWNTPGQYVVYVAITTSAGGQIIPCHQCVIVEPGVTALIGTTGYTINNNGCVQVCDSTSVTFNNLSFSGIISSDWDFGDGFFT
ncbi:MAG TPA: hypothetical protein VE978_02930, partial [Chitinophagales bacterium]|nr:hypothetical protein [Chitinophagales bacterium]